MCDDLSFFNTRQKTLKTSKKIFQIPRVDEKKLHTLEFQLKGNSNPIKEVGCPPSPKNITYGSAICYVKIFYTDVQKNIIRFRFSSPST